MDQSNTKDKMEPIAVVGLGCRFPGDGTSPDNLWSMMTQGVNAWSKFPENRVNIESYYHPSGDRQGSICFRGAHFLKQDVAAFDSAFFSIPADEAKAIDPQQRMLLEVSVEALDNAGVDRDAIRKSETGVWVGSFVKDYEQIVLRDPDYSPIYGATGNGIAIMSNRISYFLDINGPSMTIDTGCSASLVCVHNACQALRDGEIDMGLAGGAGLILTPNTMMPMTALNFLSPDGKCYTFDARANGYGRGEGIGIVVLKRLSDAIRDNDNIRAVIRGSRVNQDGRTPGITLPSSEAQIRNINGVYKRAGLSTDKTAYVECHGTGTQAGDGRELRAISSALCPDRTTDNPIYVGSLKTNIGHLEGCAGIAGLIKGVLTVEHGVIPKHLNFEAPGNPAIDFVNWKVKVPLENTSWPVNGLRRAGVNCFGFGGTNAHVILDDAAHYLSERNLSAHHSTAIIHNDIRDPSVAYDMLPGMIAAIKARTTEISKLENGSLITPRDVNSQVFVFSAHEQRALERLLGNISDYVEQHKKKTSTNFLENLAYTLGCRRTNMQWKVSITARSSDELVDKLRETDKSSFVRTSNDKAPNIALIFGGQGAQWFAMGRELLRFDIFLESIVAATKYMREKLHSPFNLLAELLKEDEALSNINNPEISQPASTAIQVALVDMFVHFYGLRPSAVAGHSSGEIAAAYATGVISRETAWELAYYRGQVATFLTKNHRGQLVTQLAQGQDDTDPEGRMLAVGLSEQAVLPYIEAGNGKVVVACINSPESVTLSGDAKEIMQVHELLDAAGVFNRLLVVNIAYHSPHMQRVKDLYHFLIGKLSPRQPMRKRMTHPNTKGKVIAVSDLDIESDGWEGTPEFETPVMYSSVTGEPVPWEELTPDYWVSNMVSPVQFSGSMTQMMSGAHGPKPDIILELGPHAALQSPIREILETVNKSGTPPAYISALRRNKNAATTAITAAGELWSRGCNISMAWVIMRNLQTRLPRLLADLPNYPWNHETLYWHESHLSRANRFQVYGRQDLIGRPTADSVPFQPRWRGFLRVKENPWIEHHQVQKSTIYPAAGMVAMVIEGAKQMAVKPFAGIEVSQFRIEKAMLVPSSDHGLEYALNMSQQKDSTRIPGGRGSSAASEEATTYDFFIYSKPLESSWQQHGSGFVTIHPKSSANEEADLQARREHDAYIDARTRCDEAIIPRQYYETLDVIGMNYGPLFKNITALHRRENTCSFTIQVPDTKSVMPARFEFPHTIHPATLDSVFQSAFSLGGESMVPSHIGSIYVSADLPTTAGTELVGYADAGSEQFNGREATVKFVMSGASWKTESQSGVRQSPLIVVEDMTFTALSTDAETASSGTGFLPNHHNLCSEIEWEKYTLPPPTTDSMSTCSTNLSLPGGIFLLLPNRCHSETKSIAMELKKKLECDVRYVDSLVDGEELPAYCISLLEASPGENFVWQWSNADFGGFRMLVEETTGMLWITRGAQVETRDPKAGLFQALARTLMSEDPRKNIVTFDLSADSDTVADIVGKTFALFKRSFADAQETKGPKETEFADRDGQLLVPRLTTLNSLNKMITRGSSPPQPEPQLMSKYTDRPLELKMGDIGKPHSLYWDDDKRANLPLPPDEVKIKVISTSLSSIDVDIIMRHGRDDVLGTDVYGVITTVGENVRDLNPGDRVLGMVRGSFRDHVRCHQALVQKVRDDEVDPSMVVIPTSFAVADYVIYTLSRLKKGGSILIYAGASSFGQAAIRMAKEMGCRIFTTVGNDKQRLVVRDSLYIPDDQILYEKDKVSSVIDSIHRLTNGKGVDVVFDPTSEHRISNRHVVGQSGQVIRFTNKDIISGRIVDFTGKTFTSTVLDVAYLIKKEPWRLGESLKSVCASGIRKWMPNPDTSLKRIDISELPNAVTIFAEHGQCDLVYCDRTESTMVPILCRNPHPVQQSLKADGTYVLAGQGGLAVRIAKLLAANGVKNIALLSRSGGSSQESQACVSFLRNRGVNVQVLKVDICDKEALQHAVSHMEQTMPRIRGLFQCAATIRDAVFDNMTYDDWQTAIRPKTTGSWNLYECFPKTMDFFIFLSSSAGVMGNRGQANYAAGNAFQDALARHINNTTTNPTRAVSIDLGPVLGAGMLAEDPKTLDKLKASGFFGIRLQDFERVVERAVAGSVDDETAVPAQVIMGVGTGGLIRQNKPADAYWTRTALFARLNRVDLPADLADDPQAAFDNDDSVRYLLSRASDIAEAGAVVATGLRTMLAHSMNMRAEDVDEGKPPSAYGVDSLVAVGVRNWVHRECGVDVSVFEVLSDSSIAELAIYVVERKGGVGGGRRE